MAKARIRELRTTRIAVRQIERDFDPADRASWLLVLQQEVKARRLPLGPGGYRIQVWTPKWAEHSDPSLR